MIHLSPDGIATTLAALVVIAVSMTAHARHRRQVEARRQYRRGEESRAVRQLRADALEAINAGARGVR